MGIKFSSLRITSIFTMPVVVVLGATGTGKSKLAIELAKTFNGEIISADSMQVYKGLEIVTNKVLEEEQKQVPHHLIGCTDPLKRYTVVDFQSKAIPLINNLLAIKKLPIIVGGTNYYIESLLWDVLLKNEISSDTLLLDAEKEKIRGNESDSESLLSLKCNSVNLHTTEEDKQSENFNITAQDLLQTHITQDSFKHIPSSVLHKALLEVDPVKASSLHPNDKRKIIRSLQVYQKLQNCHSDLLQHQRSQKGGSPLGGPLRLKNSIMLWLQCEKDVLEKRLDERVDDMIKNGLLSELLNFHQTYNKLRLQNNEQPSYEEGIFQSIGFKEFHEYLILPEEEQVAEKGETLFKQGVENMKLHTRQYARKQGKWITNRFLKTPNREVPPIYGLDATNLELWDQNVLKVAYSIVQSKLQGKQSPIPPLPVEKRPENAQEAHYCDICDKVIVGTLTWEVHLNSRSHHRRKDSLKKKVAATCIE